MHPAVWKGNKNSGNKTRQQNYACKICRQNHGLKSCQYFLTMSIEERMVVVRNYQYCWICLAASHQTYDCNNRKTCTYCDQLHNSLLHQDPSPGRSILMFNDLNMGRPGFSCRVCGDEHGLKSCQYFLQMSVDERMDVVRKYKYCWICLAVSHDTNDCNEMNTCIFCDQLHNSLLHRDTTSNAQSISNFNNMNTAMGAPHRNFCCRICGDEHGLKDCRKFLKMSVEERMDVVRKKKHCWICLAVSHNSKKCTSNKKCKRCGQMHNTLLHQDLMNELSVPESDFPIVERKKNDCLICGGNHRLSECRRFLGLPIIKRIELLEKFEYCKLCFGVTHRTSECRTNISCDECGKMHNTLIHLDLPPDRNNKSNVFPHIRRNEPPISAGRRNVAPQSILGRNPLITPVNRRQVSSTALRKQASNTSAPRRQALSTASRNKPATKTASPANASTTSAPRANTSNTSAPRANTSNTSAPRRQASTTASRKKPATTTASRANAQTTSGSRTNNRKQPATRRTDLSIQRRRPNPVNATGLGNMQDRQFNPDVIAQTCLLLEEVQKVLRNF